MIQKKSNKYKDYISILLNEYALQHKLRLETEYQGIKNRRFKFDWAFPQLNIAFEYEGLNFTGGKSRHLTISGYSNDTEKYNLAQLQGWKVLRYTAKTVENLKNDLKLVEYYVYFQRLKANEFDVLLS